MKKNATVIAARIAAFALLILVLAALLPALEVSAASSYLVIDGVNITRTGNVAVVYRGIEKVGQSRWGHSVVIDGTGKVIRVYDSENPPEDGITVPEGGMVVSAGGSKVSWLRDNLEKGRYAYYDGYTKRLFAYKAGSMFDPYTKISFDGVVDVSDGEGTYRVNDAGNAHASRNYSVAVNEKGVVCARGHGISAPSGGKLFSTADEITIEKFITSVPLGASCSLNGNLAEFTFDSTMLARALGYGIAAAKAQIEEAKADYRDADYVSADALVEEAEAALAGELNYRTVFPILNRFEEELPVMLADKTSVELRAAVYSPEETSADAVAAVIESAKSAGINKIMLHLTNGYGTFLVMPEGSKFTQDEKFGGFDVLAAYIAECAKRDIGLEVCLDVYYNEFAAIAEPAWLTKTNTGETGMSNRFFSPASEEFNEYLLGYVDWLITKYDFKGLTLDWARFPKFSETTDLGYDSATLERFANEYSLSERSVGSLGEELFKSSYWGKWVEFRRGLVTETVKSISETVREKRPDMSLTVTTPKDSVDYYYLQDITEWIKSGVVDGVCMSFFNYDSAENDPVTARDYLTGIISEKAALISALAGDETYFFVGIDSRLPLDAAAVNSAVLESRASGANGVIFSDLGGIVEQHYSENLSSGLFAEKTAVPGYNAAESEKALLDYSKTKINSVIKDLLNGCDEDTVDDAFSLINEYRAKIGEKGLSAEDAEELESRMAMVFSQSVAKSAVMRDFHALAKYARLSKSVTEYIPPEESEDPGTSEDDSSPVEESEGSAEESVPEEESEVRPEEGPEPGRIIAYIFVGVTLAAAVAALAVGIVRKNKAAKTKNREKFNTKSRE